MDTVDGQTLTGISGIMVPEEFWFQYFLQDSSFLEFLKESAAKAVAQNSDVGRLVIGLAW